MIILSSCDMQEDDVYYVWDYNHAYNRDTARAIYSWWKYGITYKGDLVWYP